MIQFITGKPGSGKSKYIYNKVIKESISNNRDRFYIITPEQYNLEVQKRFISMHPNKGVFNVDIISMTRLGHLITDEFSYGDFIPMDDQIRNFITMKILRDNKDYLKILGNNISKEGQVNSIASLVKEIDIYKISNDKINNILENEKIDLRLKDKLSDALLIKNEYENYIKDNYITDEMLLELASKEVCKLDTFKNATFVFDGFTGFTPNQLELIINIASICKDIYIVFTTRKKYDEQTIGLNSNIDNLPFSNIKKINDLAEHYNIGCRENIYIDKPNDSNNELSYLKESIFNYENKEIYNGSDSSVKIYRCDNAEKEVKNLVSLIEKDILGGLRYKDIGVVLCENKTYSKYIEYYFNKNNIPYHSDNNYDITLNPYIEYIRALLNLLNSNFDIDSVFRYLKSYYSPIDINVVFTLENYIRAKNIKGFKKWDNGFYSKTSSFNEDELVVLNKNRELFVEYIREIKNAVSSKKSINEITDAILVHLSDEKIINKRQEMINIYERENNLYMLSVEDELSDCINDTFTKLKSILGETKVSLKEYTDILEAGLLNRQIGVTPQGIDQINIGDLLKTRFGNIKVLYVLGANENNFPPAINNRDVLTDAQKRILEKNNIFLSPLKETLAGYNNYYIYLMISKPEQRLCLSYSKNNTQGELINKSSLIEKIQTNMPCIEVEEGSSSFYNLDSSLEYVSDNFRDIVDNIHNLTNIDNTKTTMLSYLISDNKSNNKIQKLLDGFNNIEMEDYLDKKIADKLFENFNEISVSKAQQFVKCPLAYYLRYTLNLKEREELKLENVDRGNILHNALEIIFKKINKDNKKWGDLEDAYIDECVDFAKSNISISYRDIMDNFVQYEYIANATVDLIKTNLKSYNEVFKLDGYIPSYFEYQFNNITNSKLTKLLIDEKEINLNGKIDRIDIAKKNNSNYLRVIDYKLGDSSSGNFNLQNIFDGTDIQLPLYSLIASDFLNIERVGVMSNITLDYKAFKADTNLLANIYKETCKNSFYLKDNDAISILTSDNSDFPIKILNKNGSFNGKLKNRFLDETELKYVQHYSYIKLKSICKSILGGEIRLNTTDNCKYCKYNDICKSNKDSVKNTTIKKDRDSILQDMKIIVNKYDGTN